MKKTYMHSLIYILLFLASVACGQTKKSLENSNNIETKIDTPKATYNEYYYYNLGEKTSDLGAYRKAITYFNKAIEINPDYLIAYLERAHCYEEMYYFDKAIKDVEFVLGKDKANPLAYNALGNIYFGKADPLKAIECYSKAIKISPSYTRAYYNRGYIYNEIGQKKDACADWKKAASLGNKRSLEMLAKYCK